MVGAHAEDDGEGGDVGGDCEVVVGYSQGHGQALRFIAKQTFTSAAKKQNKEEEWKKTEYGQKEREKECHFHWPCTTCIERNLMFVMVPSAGACKRF